MTDTTDIDAACQNTDRELYRELDKDGAGDYYSNSIHMTEHGSIGMNVGGYVIVKTIAEWFDAMSEVERCRNLERQLWSVLGSINNVRSGIAAQTTYLSETEMRLHKLLDPPAQKPEAD